MSVEIGRQREFWIDVLRCVATLSVIVVHTAAPLVYGYGQVSDFDWWVGDIFSNSLRFCVPVFVMVTGSLLLTEEYSLLVFLKRRFFRLVPPFLFWMAIYMLLNLVLHYDVLSPLTFRGAVNTILFDHAPGSLYHLWYVFMLVGLYLFVPFIGKAVRYSTNHEILYFLILWALLLFLPEGAQKDKIECYMPGFTGYIGYLVLGYYLSQRIHLDYRRVRLLSCLFMFVGVVVTVVGTYFLVTGRGCVNIIWSNCLTPNVLLVSIGLFLLVRFRSGKGVRNRFVSFMVKYGYGIYLSHVFVLILLGRLGISYQLVNPLIGVPVTAGLCLCGSAGTTWLLSKLPYGHWIAGKV